MRSRNSRTIIPGKSFAAIDFETATSERNSACAIGVVVFEDGSPSKRLRLLIRPPGNCYDAINVMIHGIQPSDTKDSPQFPEVWKQVSKLLGEHMVIAHNAAFDVSVMRRSSEYYGYKPSPFYFACTYRVARSSMPELGSWTLPTMVHEFDIPLVHHDPLSDAEAAGHLWLALPKRFGVTHSELLDWYGYSLGHCDLSKYKPFSNAMSSQYSRTRQRSSTSSVKKRSLSAKKFTARIKPDPEGILFGKRVAFTGMLKCMPRHEAFQAVVDAGAVPSQSVSTRTDYLVVGITDLQKVGKSGLSLKFQKAQTLISAGSDIRIIDEDQFICLLVDTYN